MEDKIRIEEETRQSLNRHGGDIMLVAEETGRTYDYIIMIRLKMKKDIMKNPEVSLQRAGNVSCALIEGRRARTQNLWDMLESLKAREQMMVCDICKSDVRKVPGTHIEGVMAEYFCPVCNKNVQRTLKDNADIYRLKLDILRTLMLEDEKMTDHMVKMKWTNQPDNPQHTTNIKQNNLVFLGNSPEEKRIIEGYTGMKPMDRALFADKLRKDLLKLNEKLGEAESEGTGDKGSDTGSQDPL